MSLNAQPDVAPPPPMSVVEAFKAAPALVKVLAAYFYLPALHVLVLAVVSAVGTTNTGFGIGLLFFGFLFALIGFLMGKGIARGAHGTWLLALVLSGLAFAASIFDLLDAVTVNSIVSIVIFVGTAALLLTPVVRQHCTKK